MAILNSRVLQNSSFFEYSKLIKFSNYFSMKQMNHITLNWVKSMQIDTIFQKASTPCFGVLALNMNVRNIQ